MIDQQFCSVPSVLYENRFCEQENFDIVASGTSCDKDIAYSEKLVKLHYPSFKKTEPLLVYENTSCRSVVISSDIYTFIRQNAWKNFSYDVKKVKSIDILKRLSYLKM